MKDIDLILERMNKKGLVKGYKSFRSSNIDYKLIEPRLIIIVNEKLQRERSGEVLSLIYLSGRTFNQNIASLVERLFSQHDYPTFLKQAYRFDIYEPLKDKIEYAIEWHIKNNKVDAFAWRIKFLSLSEALAHSNIDGNVYEKIDEEKSIEENKVIRLELLPIKRGQLTGNSYSTEKYIQVQYDKKKLDCANLSHTNTQNILQKYLSKFGVHHIETKHIDVYAEINDVHFLFEVKSITQRNERPQTRSAVSQLYEYSFLYGLVNPTYFVVFSSQPDNCWIINYLEEERNIRVLWISEEGELDGTSSKYLEKVCIKYAINNSKNK